MGIYPKKYTKAEFIKFLEKNNVGDNIITKFVELPEVVERNGHKYEFYINSTWYNTGNTHYNFELNYYSEELIEYLFNSKVFSDVEISINNLMCDLMGSNCIEARKR